MAFHSNGFPMRPNVIAIAAVLASLAPAVAHAKSPRFEDYAVRQVLNEPAAAPILDDEAKRAFRTRLRQAAKAPPNFAGRYSVVTWGCGTNCIQGMLLNRKTGEVLALPSDGDSELMDMRFEAGSALMTMTNRSYVAQLDLDREPTTTFFVFTDKAFKVVHRDVDRKRKWADIPAD